MVWTSLLAEDAFILEYSTMQLHMKERKYSEVTLDNKFPI